jgi:hypothetical protein
MWTKYVTPNYMLGDRQVETRTERGRKLEAARRQRQSRRLQAALRGKVASRRGVG